MSPTVNKWSLSGFGTGDGGPAMPAIDAAGTSTDPRAIAPTTPVVTPTRFIDLSWTFCAASNRRQLLERRRANTSGGRRSRCGVRISCWSEHCKGGEGVDDVAGELLVADDGVAQLAGIEPGADPPADRGGLGDDLGVGGVVAGGAD
jgi:hypothetical protein